MKHLVPIRHRQQCRELAAPRFARCPAAGVALAVSSLVSLGSPAWAEEDLGHRVYRCVVLGERLACPAAQPVPAERIDEQIVAGSYARYLMTLGHDKAKAIEAARAIGEVPVRRVVRIVTSQLTDLQKYERHMGRLAATAETRHEVLSEQPIDAVAQSTLPLVSGSSAR